MDWIKCTDRMPPDMEPVIVTMNDGRKTTVLPCCRWNNKYNEWVSIRSIAKPRSKCVRRYWQIFFLSNYWEEVRHLKDVAVPSFSRWSSRFIFP